VGANNGPSDDMTRHRVTSETAGAIRLVQLRALLAVERNGSFSAAAEELGTVQSNVSAQVANLERELGVCLVDRRGGCLTPEGHVTARHARRVTAELTTLVNDLDSLFGNVVGQVRVGLISTVAQWLVLPLLDSAHDMHPGMSMILEEGTSVALLDRLLDGHADLAVVDQATVRADFTFDALFTEELIAAVPRSAQRPSDHLVTLRELAQYPLMLPAQHSAYRAVVDRAAEASEVVLHPVAEIDGVRLLATMVAAGHAAAVLPATAVAGWAEDVCHIRPIDGLPPRTIGLARVATVSEGMAARAVRFLVTEVVAQQLDAVAGLHSCR
jgi:DNA-binding transcriptional LysR family regulator